MKLTKSIILCLAAVLMLFISTGCDSVDPIIEKGEESLSEIIEKAEEFSSSAINNEDEESTNISESEEPEDGMKSITVYPQPDVISAYINDIEVFPGQENTVSVDTGQPIVARYSFNNTRGEFTEVTQNLDKFFDYHVLKSNGGWASTIHRSQFEDDKTEQ